MPRKRKTTALVSTGAAAAALGVTDRYLLKLLAEGEFTAGEHYWDISRRAARRSNYRWDLEKLKAHFGSLA
jgi:hypothetical protein